MVLRKTLFILMRHLKLLLAGIVACAPNALAGSHDQVSFLACNTCQPVIQGQTVYLLKHTSLYSYALFTPEGPQWWHSSSNYQIYAVDFGREDSLRAVSREVHAGRSIDFDAPIVSIDAKGAPKIRLPAQVVKQLRSAANIGCDGVLTVDQQDARILYYECIYAGLFYRFIEPSTRPQEFRLDPKFTPLGGMRGAEIHFFSVADERKVYFHAHTGDFVEVDLERATARPIDAFAGFERPANKFDGEVMVGITSNLRIARIPGSNSSGVQVLRQGQPLRRYVIPEESNSTGPQPSVIQSIYLAPQNQVLWQLHGTDGRTSIVTLDVDSGEFRRTSFRHPARD